MTMDDAELLFTHWRRSPPLVDIVAALAQTFGVSIGMAEEPSQTAGAGEPPPPEFEE